MNTSGLLHNYGYVAVCALVLAECLGVPLPGETILIAAGVYAGDTGRLSVWGIFAGAAAAAAVGGLIGYFIGLRGGYRLVRRYGSRIHLDEARLKVGLYVFDRHGSKVVFLGRFVSVLRTYAAFLAGTLKMPGRPFILWNALGAVVWAALYSFVPYKVGGAIKGATSTATAIVGAVAVVVVVTVLVMVRRQASALEERAEAAYPGPLPER